MAEQKDCHHLRRHHSARGGRVCSRVSARFVRPAHLGGSSCEVEGSRGGRGGRQCSSGGKWISAGGATSPRGPRKPSGCIVAEIMGSRLWRIGNLVIIIIIIIIIIVIFFFSFFVCSCFGGVEEGMRLRRVEWRKGRRYFFLVIWLLSCDPNRVNRCNPSPLPLPLHPSPVVGQPGVPTGRSPD